MYRFVKVTIYLGFVFIVTISDIFKLIIIKLIIKFDDPPFENGVVCESVQDRSFEANAYIDLSWTNFHRGHYLKLS